MKYKIWCEDQNITEEQSEIYEYGYMSAAEDFFAKHDRMVDDSEILQIRDLDTQKVFQVEVTREVEVTYDVIDLGFVDEDDSDEEKNPDEKETV
jgi:hypothetical protein